MLVNQGVTFHAYIGHKKPSEKLQQTRRIVGSALICKSSHKLSTIYIIHITSKLARSYYIYMRLLWDLTNTWFFIE